MDKNINIPYQTVANNNSFSSYKCCKPKTLIIIFIITFILVQIIHHKFRVVEEPNFNDLNELNFDEINAPTVITFINRPTITESGFLKLEDANEILGQIPEHLETFYFIETSKSGKIRSRQMCAVESTAKTHPEAFIFLLIVDNPGDVDLNENHAVKSVLQSYQNIYVLALNMTTYFLDTPLEEWYKKKGELLTNSKFYTHHCSDVLRMTTLYKYGGKYLDLDFIIKKSLSNFTNFVAIATTNMISNGALGFNISKHPIVTEFIFRIRESYNPKQFTANGPSLVTSAMISYCGVPLANMTKETCRGIEPVPSKVFYPIYYPQWRLFFSDKNYDKTMKLLEDSPAVHVWNKLSVNETIEASEDSKIPYALLAKEYCPTSYWASDGAF